MINTKGKEFLKTQNQKLFLCPTAKSVKKDLSLLTHEFVLFIIVSFRR